MGPRNDRPSRRAAVVRARRLLAEIHSALEARILEPLDPRHLEREDQAVDDLWWLSQTAGIDLHSCGDRYCPCHVSIWLRQPTPLPLG